MSERASLAFLRAFAISQGCSSSEALQLCEAWPRLFDAGVADFLAKSKGEAPVAPESEKRPGESDRAWAERLREGRERNARRVHDGD